MINSLPTATVTNIIAQNQMTIAINKQNELKEEKANKTRGSLKKDVDIKTIKVTLGEDNATDILHPQRFLFRTP